MVTRNLRCLWVCVCVYAHSCACWRQFLVGLLLEMWHLLEMSLCSAGILKPSESFWILTEQAVFLFHVCLSPINYTHSPQITIWHSCTCHSDPLRQQLFAAACQQVTSNKYMPTETVSPWIHFSQGQRHIQKWKWPAKCKFLLMVICEW